MLEEYSWGKHTPLTEDIKHTTLPLKKKEEDEDADEEDKNKTVNES